jgi:hypothetical protein
MSTIAPSRPAAIPPERAVEIVGKIFLPLVTG